MPPKPLDGLLSVEPYKPGESVLPGFPHPIKIASNENPLGCSPKAKAAYLAAAETLEIYPDGAWSALRAAIGARYGLDPARLICGAGSDEIFQMLGRAYLKPGDEIVQSEHAFSIYGIVARVAGAAVKSAKDASYTADVDAMLALVGPNTKIVFLANPNNPTGTYLPAEEVARLHAGLPDNVLFVLDSAYAEYVKRNDYAAGIELVAAHQNVLMTRTFSKIYGLAALRLGWAYGPAGVIDALNRVRGPFNVCAPAIAAGVAAMEDTAFAEESAAYNMRELARVTRALEALGLEVTPSVGNFVLAHFTADRTAKDADQALRAAGIIVRPMGGYGLPNALRFSIGKESENDAVLAVMRTFMG